MESAIARANNCCAAWPPGISTFPASCSTGLRAGDSDISEDAGCANAGDDAWLSPFQMVQGESYALCVSNFTSTGNGFLIDFSGSGLFLGPEAAFTTDPPAVCLGTAVEVLMLPHLRWALLRPGNGVRRRCRATNRNRSRPSHRAI